MAQVDDFDVTKLEWESILGEFYRSYERILYEEFSEDPEIFELLDYTYVSVRYDPRFVGNGRQNIEEGTTAWDVLGSRATTALQEILVTEYAVPEEYAAAIDVGNIGVSFLSPAARRRCRDWQTVDWHTCPGGTIIMICCS